MNLCSLGGDPVAVTRNEKRWEFRPTPLHADATFTMFLMVALASLLLTGWLCWMARGIPIMPIWGGMGGLAAAVGFWQALRARRLRHTPLVIARDGCISYGDRELCPSELVRTIQLKRVPSGEDWSYQVSLLLADGGEVRLPSPYFDSFFYRQQARSFAERLAVALQRELVDCAP
jgi:hypothetical protein